MSGPVCVTLNAINIGQIPAGGGARLLAYLGKTSPDNEPLPLVTILDSNGLSDALWALRVVKGEDARIRRFAVWCARQVQHLMTDPRSVAALDVAERYANGMATADELRAAEQAAWRAPDVYETTAAGAAAKAAIWAAVPKGIWSGAGTAAFASSVAARRDAAAGGVAAEEVAGEVARAAQAFQFRRLFGGDA